MAKHPLISCAAPVLVGCLLSRSAFASPTYPPIVQSELQLMQAPDCTLCHRDDLGGAGTVIRPFGRTMMGRFQLTGGNNIAALKAALAASDAQNADSDGDGVGDIDELLMNTNPNVGVSGVETAPQVPLPETGCALAHGAPAESAALGLMLAALGFIARRSRHHR